MNDNKLADTQIVMAKNHANSAVSCLEIVCKDCKSKERCNREIQRCGISQARMRIAVASRILSEIIDRRKEVIE